MEFSHGVLGFILIAMFAYGIWITRPIDNGPEEHKRRDR